MDNIFDLTQQEIDYLVEFVENDNANDWERAKNDLHSDMHRDSIRKSWNVGKYCGYSVYRFMQDKMEKEFSSDEEYARLEEIRDKEYKERVRLQDANREKRKYLRDFSRVETLIEYIDKKLDEHTPLEVKPCSYHITNGNEAAILVSDLHAGMKVDSVFNYYDVDVMNERMNELADKTIAFCKKDNVSHLNIECLGDVISGLIHGGTIMESQEDVIDQIFSACEVLEMFIKKLAENIPSVKVYVTYGNHGRVHASKSDGSNKENFERLIAPFLRKEFRNTDIKIIDGGYEDFVTYTLKDGKLIVLSHGTKDNKANANQIYSKLLGKDVYDVHIGHFHDYAELNGTTVNGSVMASDSYAISIRKNSPAIQVLKVYLGEDVATYKLKLA